MVLGTGDGKGYRNNEGFLFDLEGFIEDGWNVEVLSWTHSCHRRLKQLAEEKGRFIPLERHYNSITFIQNDRWAEMVRL